MPSSEGLSGTRLAWRACGARLGRESVLMAVKDISDPSGTSRIIGLAGLAGWAACRSPMVSGRWPKTTGSSQSSRSIRWSK
jgi:hypothetical protein